MIRLQHDAKVGIRCSFLAVEKKPGGTVIFFDGMSEFGVKKLSVNDTVKFEVIGMPSKVVFAAKILEKSRSGLTCSLPASLISIERRQNLRYGTTDSKMAYFRPSFWTPQSTDIAAPPAFEQFHFVASWIPILDMSAGGLCIRTLFPSILHALDGHNIDENAQIILPMSEPITLGVAIRWQRRIKNRYIDAERERYQLDFRFGVEFIDLSDDANLKLKQFLRQLSVADAI
ncbi:MAG: hypothetical protein ACOH5I_24970 [Oligoflexus sp.]